MLTARINTAPVSTMSAPSTGSSSGASSDSNNALSIDEPRDEAASNSGDQSESIEIEPDDNADNNDDNAREPAADNSSAPFDDMNTPAPTWA